MDAHTIISGLASIVGVAASVMLTWLRDDLRTQAAKTVSLETAYSDLKQKFEHLSGVLEGKGLV